MEEDASGGMNIFQPSCLGEFNANDVFHHDCPNLNKALVVEIIMKLYIGYRVLQMQKSEKSFKTKWFVKVHVIS